MSVDQKIMAFIVELDMFITEALPYAIVGAIAIAIGIVALLIATYTDY